LLLHCTVPTNGSERHHPCQVVDHGSIDTEYDLDMFRQRSWTVEA